MKKRLLSSIVVIFVLLVAVIVTLFVWIPHYRYIVFENHFLEIMKQLNCTESKAEVRSWFVSQLNFTEIYDWVHEKLEFVPFNETFERHTVPFEILDSGKGRCEEFGILYVATCLAHGYESRLVVSIEVGNPLVLTGLHVWAEVELNATWVHVDPSERRWNEPHMYENWSWGKDIGLSVKIYAFKEEECEDVTLVYAQKD